jgi:anti-anti-sigma factor
MGTGFQFACDPPLARLIVTGELDGAASGPLDDVLVGVYLSGCTTVEVDLHDVFVVDVSALRVLSWEQRRLVRAGGSLDVVAASNTFVAVCRRTGYDALLPAGHPTRERPHRQLQVVHGDVEG